MSILEGRQLQELSQPYLLRGLVLSCRPGNCPSVSLATAYTTSLSPSATHKVRLVDTAAVGTVTAAVKLALAVDLVATAVSTSCAVGSGSPALRGASHKLPALLTVYVRVKLIGGVNVAVRSVTMGGMLSVVRTRLHCSTARQPWPVLKPTATLLQARPQARG
jgi:hypothetical protein